MVGFLSGHDLRFPREVLRAQRVRFGVDDNFFVFIFIFVLFVFLNLGREGWGGVIEGGDSRVG